MSTEIATLADGWLDQADTFVRDGLEAIASSYQNEQITEIRARIAAAKAWAKTAGKIKEARLALLTLEVMALRRAHELGADLPGSDQRAAEILAGLSEPQVRELIRTYQNVTTANGIAWAYERDSTEREEHRISYQLGRQFGTRATVITNEAVDFRDHAARRVHEVIESLLDEYVETGEPFTIDDLADSLVAHVDEPVDDAFKDGVREMCRTAIRRQPTQMIDGTVIPKFITARTPDGGFARIPTYAASVANLDESIAMRLEQLRQDQEALRRFQEFVDRVKSIPGSAADANVGDLITATLADRAA